MSKTIHHAIIVTDWDCVRLREIRTEAAKIFGTLVSPVIDSHKNSWQSFMIAPDGSGEGWSTSIEHDGKRSVFMKWMAEKHPGVSCIQIEYGETKSKLIINHH